MDKRVSPLKDRPLRQAGQSVQEQLDEFIDDVESKGILVHTFDRADKQKMEEIALQPVLEYTIDMIEGMGKPGREAVDLLISVAAQYNP